MMIIWEALTPAQRRLMQRIKEDGRGAPYGPEWPTFYRLKGMGLMAYDGATSVVLTATGRELMERSK